MSAETSLADTIDRIKTSVVGIGTVYGARHPTGEFIATGFVVGDGHHVITNAHTVPTLDDDSREHLAVLTGKTKVDVRRAHVVSTDAKHDLALLRMEGEPIEPLRFGYSSTVREGVVYAFTGFPIGMVLGMRPVTHRGIVSAITPIAIPQASTRNLNTRMIKRLRDPYDVFQLDATAYPGNSGSPLYEPESGKVIGVINKIFVKESKENVLAKPSGITYAVPAQYARAILTKAGLTP